MKLVLYSMAKAKRVSTEAKEKEREDRDIQWRV